MADNVDDSFILFMMTK